MQTWPRFRASAAFQTFLRDYRAGGSSNDAAGGGRASNDHLESFSNAGRPTFTAMSAPHLVGARSFRSARVHIATAIAGMPELHEVEHENKRASLKGKLEVPANNPRASLASSGSGSGSGSSANNAVKPGALPGLLQVQTQTDAQPLLATAAASESVGSGAGAASDVITPTHSQRIKKPDRSGSRYLVA